MQLFTEGCRLRICTIISPRCPPKTVQKWMIIFSVFQIEVHNLFFLFSKLRSTTNESKLYYHPKNTVHKVCETHECHEIQLLLYMTMKQMVSELDFWVAVVEVHSCTLKLLPNTQTFGPQTPFLLSHFWKQSLAMQYDRNTFNACTNTLYSLAKSSVYKSTVLSYIYVYLFRYFWCCGIGIFSSCWLELSD